MPTAAVGASCCRPMLSARSSPPTTTIPSVLSPCCSRLRLPLLARRRGSLPRGLAAHGAGARPALPPHRRRRRALRPPLVAPPLAVPDGRDGAGRRRRDGPCRGLPPPGLAHHGALRPVQRRRRGERAARHAAAPSGGRRQQRAAHSPGPVFHAGVGERGGWAGWSASSPCCAVPSRTLFSSRNLRLNRRLPAFCTPSVCAQDERPRPGRPRGAHRAGAEPGRARAAGEQRQPGLSADACRSLLSLQGCLARCLPTLSVSARLSLSRTHRSSWSRAAPC